MKRIAIIGGGISGLSAAFSLEQQRLAGVALEFVLYEAGPRFGGVIFTEHVDGFLIEAGPDSFLSEKPWAAELCHELGIGDQLIGSNDSRRKTYILVNGKLISIPDGMAFMVPTKILPAFLSPLFSLPTKLRMLREWFHPRREVASDETVASFIERHYGKEMVERLADPLLSGVYGGDASQLSLQSVLPRFAKMQADYGSLGKAMIQNRRKYGNKYPRPLFTSLRDGMQEMINAILRRLPNSSIRLNARVNSLLRVDRGWSISTSSESSEQFDAVILALPAYAAAKLIEAPCPDLALELRGIPYSSSVIVSLAYGEEVRSRLPPGFGYLVPRSEGKRLLAATFVHNKFSHRVPAGRMLIRCFLGGSRDEAVLELSEQEILDIVRRELEETLAIRTEPLFSRIFKWKAAMAQYNVGHQERLQRIERLRREQPGLFFAGNAYEGIGVPDCVRSGQQAAIGALDATR